MNFMLVGKWAQVVKCCNLYPFVTQKVRGQPWGKKQAYTTLSTHMLLIFLARRCIYALSITQVYFVPDLMTVLPECNLLKQTKKKKSNKTQTNMQLWQLKSMKSLNYKKWWITSIKRWRALCSHAILIRSNTWFSNGDHCILNMYVDLIFFQRVHNFSHEEHIVAHSYGH